MTKHYWGIILMLWMSFAKTSWSLRPQQSSIPSVVLDPERQTMKIEMLNDFDPTSISSVRDTTTTIRGGAKFSDLSVRATSAVVVLLGLFLLLKNTGKVGVMVLILASQVGMFDEVMNVSSVSDPTKWLAFLSHLLFWDGRHLVPADKVNLVHLAAFGLTALHIVTLVLVQNQKPSSDEFSSESLSTFVQSQLAAGLVVGASSAFLATLQAFSAIWIAFPGLLVIVNDTMAYIAGVLFGKHPLLPNISPKKTWEGFMGAAVCTLALAKPLSMWMIKGDNIPDKYIYILALYVSLVAPFGGFLASTVKRNFGAKDFGAVMPGHGGLVDRLDCQLLTAPFVYLYLKQWMGTA